MKDENELSFLKNLSKIQQPFKLLEETGKADSAEADSIKEVVTTCTLDCGGSCPLKVRIEKGIIRSITPYDDGGEPPIRACFRGLHFNHRVYAPDRLKYPLLRVGKRGEGKFRRVSWDEALDRVSDEMKRIKSVYGPEAILECAYSGSFYCLLHPTLWGAPYRLLNAFGGRTAFGTLTSNTGASWASTYTYGEILGDDSNSFSDIVNSKLIILWGFSPGDNRFGSETMHWLKKAARMGIRIICIDPCKTDTVNQLKAEWLPIRPGTDTAMLVAMAHVMITENLWDGEFVDRYTYGFDQFRDYVLGIEDGLPKTSEWAERISGVSAGIIGKLARDYATVKPAALIQGWAPGRTANGEQYHRAAITLQAMTGNIGISGGSGSCAGSQYKGANGMPSLALLILGQLILDGSRLTFGGGGAEIKPGKWADAVLKGKKGGYPSDIKMLYIAGHNLLNQRQNVNKGVQALKKVEFIVCQEQFMTPTARYADVVFPVTTNFERDDISLPWSKGCYAIYANKVIEPMWDTKSDLDIARLLAHRLCLDNFDTRTDDELLREIFDSSFLREYATYDEFKEKGLLRMEKESVVAFKEQIRDPDHHLFATPTGKIEIYATSLDRMDANNSSFSSVTPDFRKIPRIPKFIDCEEMPYSLKSKRYPLQLTTPHHKHRVHSQLFNIPKFKEKYRHEAWMNPMDASARGISTGDEIKIYNDQGAIKVLAAVTDRIMPGIIRCYEGAWYDPDANGVDSGGCVNVLIDDMLTSPAGASNFNSCLVEIEKF